MDLWTYGRSSPMLGLAASTERTREREFYFHLCNETAD